jgi:hypothetical protein
LYLVAVPVGEIAGPDHVAIDSYEGELVVPSINFPELELDLDHIVSGES